MTRYEIYSHVCPTCGAVAGRWCVFPCPGETCCSDPPSNGHEALDEDGNPTGEFHAARIALATPQPTEVLQQVAHFVREAAKGRP